MARAPCSFLVKTATILQYRAAYRAAAEHVAESQGVSARRTIERRRGLRRRGEPVGLHPLVLYLTVTAYNLTQEGAAKAAGVSSRYVRKALAAIEDRRDDAGFDSMVAGIEERMAA